MSGDTLEERQKRMKARLKSGKVIIDPAEKPFPNFRMREFTTPEAPRLEPNTEMLIWCAGFFDGEGCVSISRQISSTSRQEQKRLEQGLTSRRRSKTYYGYSLGVALSRKTPAPLERFHQFFGGHFFPYCLKKPSGSVTYYRWQHWSQGAKYFLRLMLPYLLVKRDIASLAIQFQEQMTTWNKEFGRVGYPDFVLAGREAFFFRARELNTRSKTNNHEKPQYVGPQSPDYAEFLQQLGSEEDSSGPKLIH